MGYSIFFHFVKDRDIDPNEAFVQNIKNFQTHLHIGLNKRYFEKEQDERDKLLKLLFDEIETIISQNDHFFNRLGYENLLEKQIKFYKDNKKKNKK